MSTLVKPQGQEISEFWLGYDVVMRNIRPFYSRVTIYLLTTFIHQSHRSKICLLWESLSPVLSKKERLSSFVEKEWGIGS